MKVTDFDYELPEELIAQHPVEPRDTARLLTLDKVTGEVVHKEHFYDLLEELHEAMYSYLIIRRLSLRDYMAIVKALVARLRYYS